MYHYLFYMYQEIRYPLVWPLILGFEDRIEFVLVKALMRNHKFYRIK